MPPSRPDIFLSYSREDQAMARRFAQAFGQEGFGVWWDQTLRSGEAYDQVTEEALRGARAVIVLWSRHSVVSRWVRAEATLADRNRTLVPAMIEPCERPVMFELTQTADLSKWSGEPGDPGWRGFLADVRRFVQADAEPSPRPASAPDIPRPGATDVPTLAILPFTNRSGEREDDVFADGMVEDLGSALSMNRGLRVIARSASAGYRGVSDLRAIGRELGARYLLEGNVRRVGASLRVTAQLVEAQSGAILWTQKFDRPLAELAQLQEQLVTDVAAHLGVQLTRAEMEKALRKPGDITAWEAVMRSLAMMGSSDFGPESMRLSAAEARKAVAIAPDYPLGNAMLGAWASNVYAFSNAGDEAALRESRVHARRAIKLAPDDPLVLSLAGRAIGLCGDWSEARSVLERAIELNPNLGDARSALAQIHIRFGQPEDALAQLDLADQLAPRGIGNLFNGIARAYAHYQADRHEQALQVLRKSVQAHPGLSLALNAEAAFCEKLGRHEEAREAVRRLRESHPGLTLEQLQYFNVHSWIAPEMAAETNALLGSAWREAGAG